MDRFVHDNDFLFYGRMGFRIKGKDWWAESLIQETYKAIGYSLLVVYSRYTVLWDYMVGTMDDRELNQTSLYL